MKGLSGCGQMHGTVYWSESGEKTLSSVQPELPLHVQLSGCFATKDSPVWVDSSTSDECKEFEDAVGGPKALADVTGSKAYERFSGPQIRFIFKNHPQIYHKTAKFATV